ncbi:MAG: abortive infection bacteriophage resistance protein [Psychromonas sp.]
MASFGNLSKLYGNLKNGIPAKERIAQQLGAVNHSYLPSWVQGLTQIRNLCAHHSRLWNKNLMARPKILTSPPFPWIEDVPKVDEHYKIYIHLCLIKYLLNVVKPENTFSDDFKKLLVNYPIIDPNALGMKQDWHKEALWT